MTRIRLTVRDICLHIIRAIFNKITNIEYDNQDITSLGFTFYLRGDRYHHLGYFGLMENTDRRNEGTQKL